MSASSRNLDVSWQPGFGQTEHFWVLLTEQGMLTQNITLDSGVTTHTFTSVTPGTLCRVTIVAESNGKQSDLVSEEVLTGKIKIVGLSSSSNLFSVESLHLQNLL